MAKYKKLIIILVIALIALVAAGIGLYTLTKNSTRMVELSSGQAEYYEQVYKRYELSVSTEEFMGYCEEIERVQVNEDRLVITYSCSLEDFEEVLPACKELRYVSICQEESFPDLMTISFVAFDENEVIVSYANNMVWEWMVYDKAANELINITDLKWIKYTNYR
ncbi:MAG: hypothetical protein IKT31_05780 [Firmicutes bacterium]|nr:hypothetical protein [Bacillota bacterium]